MTTDQIRQALDSHWAVSQLPADQRNALAQQVARDIAAGSTYGAALARACAGATDAPGVRYATGGTW